MKAISYLRFSTPEQALGNSTERQLESARKYCLHNDLELDEELSIADEGLSGYKGHNVQKGSLGHFLHEVQAGKIPSDTALIVEDFDRLTRQGIEETYEIVKQLTRNGIHVHVLSTRSVFKAGEKFSLFSFMQMAMKAELAHDESKKKSERIGAAWASKRGRISEGKVYTGSVPAWLKVEDGKIVEIPEMVEHVRKVFTMVSQGVGIKNTVRSIGGEVTNEDGESYSLSWYQRLINDRSVLGEFQPRDLDPIPDYYPQIIDQSQFDEVRHLLNSKKRNGRSSVGNKRNSLQADNLFSGLLFDVPLEEGATVRPLHFQKVPRGTYLMSAFSRDRKSNRINYHLVENAVLQFLSQEDWQAVAGQTESDECKAARAELESLLRDIDITERRIQRNNAAMEGEEDVATLKVFARNVAKDEAALETLRSRKDVLEANVERACRRCESLYNPEAMLDLISKNSEGANEVRMRLRAEISKAVIKIGVSFNVLNSPDFVALAIDYVNGVRHHAMFDRKGERPVMLIDGSLEAPVIKVKANKGQRLVVVEDESGVSVNVAPETPE